MRNSTTWAAVIQKVGHKYPWIELLGLMSGSGRQSKQVLCGLFFFLFWNCWDESAEIFITFTPKKRKRKKINGREFRVFNIYGFFSYWYIQNSMCFLYVISVKSKWWGWYGIIPVFKLRKVWGMWLTPCARVWCQGLHLGCGHSFKHWNPPPGWQTTCKVTVLIDAWPYRWLFFCRVQRQKQNCSTWQASEMDIPSPTWFHF